MLSKEEVLDIIAYCKENNVNRKDRLIELGLSEWSFYEARRRYLKEESESGKDEGHFIQLRSTGGFVHESMTEMEQTVNPCKRVKSVPARHHYIISKYIDHLPFHRQINRFRECGLRVPASTMTRWYEESVESLHLLYKLLRQQVMASEYIQVDESTIPVIDNDKHKTRKGYEWCVRDGITGATFFWYDRGSRSKKTAKELLGGYHGVFQSDCYEAYDQFCGVNGVLGAACWAHARRKFVDALKENWTLATQAIVMIGKLYAVEKEADEAGLTVYQRGVLRREKAYPVIRLIEKWCVDTYSKVLEKSLLGKAIAYTYSLLERLSVYVTDGRINIDNNLISI